MEKHEFIVGSRPQREWGWLVVFDLFFTGAGAGVFLPGMVLGSLPHMLTGVVLVFAGSLFLLADLTRPLRAWRVIMRPGTSWISRGALGIGVFLLLGLIHIAALSLSGGKWISAAGVPWTTGPGWLVALGVLAGVSALFVAIYPGYLLSDMHSIQLWNTSLLPILYLISCLFCGMGILYLIPFPWGAESWGWNALKLMSAGFALLGFFFLFSLILILKRQRSIETPNPFSHGSLRTLYLGGVIGIGIVLPLLLLALLFRGRTSAALLPLPGLAMTAGIFLLRYGLLKAGFHRKPV